jgi:hypothetical protein
LYQWLKSLFSIFAMIAGFPRNEDWICLMQNSASYLLLEEMLLHGQLQMTFSEFEQFVDFVRRQELITALEQQSLLDLARTVKLEEGG